jgi:hypothetical protein
MIKSYIISAFRNQRRNILYAGVNMVGLSLAIACAMVAFLNYDYAIRFNDFHKDADKIYRILSLRSINEQLLRYGMVPLPLGERLRDEFDSIEQAVAIENASVRIRHQDRAFNERMLFADAGFFYDFDPGYETDLIVTVPVYNETMYPLYRDSIRDHSRIESISGCQSHIISSDPRRGIKFASKEREAFVCVVGFNYLGTMRLRLKEGRGLKGKTRTDFEQSIIVNETLAKEMGWDSIAGKILTVENQAYQVIGLVEDMYNRGPWEQILPTLLCVGAPNNYSAVILRIQPDHLAETVLLLQT